MQEQLAALIQAGEFFASVTNNLDTFAEIMNYYFAGAKNIRFVSIILILLAFILILFIVIILYVRSVVSFLKTDKKDSLREDYDENEDEDEDEDDNNDIFNKSDAARLNQIMENQERERELEKELQKELEMARAEKEMMKQADTHKKNIQYQEEAEKEKKKKQEEKQKVTVNVDLDWQKGKFSNVLAESPTLDKEFLSYKQKQKELSELTGLIIDMLGRGVDDLKIAQTVMFRNQGKNTEDDILQLIEAIKDFINLCIEGKFATLPTYKMPMSEEEALQHLARGDSTPVLAMIENLMDYNIDRSHLINTPQNKQILFNEISNYACIFGNMATINNPSLAIGAFELAIDLNEHNITAWSRLGDMYSYAGADNKAMLAYKNVLDLADRRIHARQTANAAKMMSQQLYNQGNNLQAAKFYNDSKQYYDSLGINRRLDKQEIEIVEIIESHQQEELNQTIHNILSRKNIKAYNLA